MKKPNGSSIIDHGIRYKLKLSVEEYILCDLIYQFNKRYKVGVLINKKYFSIIGFMPDDVIRIGTQLRSRGLIITDVKKKRPATTKLWNDNFDDDAQFEEMWDVHPKGNKAEARENFIKARGMVPYNLLIEKLMDYLISQPNLDYRYQLSTWLDPKKKHWEDVLDYKGTVKAENDEKNDNSIPSSLFR